MLKDARRRPIVRPALSLKSAGLKIVPAVSIGRERSVIWSSRLNNKATLAFSATRVSPKDLAIRPEAGQKGQSLSRDKRDAISVDEMPENKPMIPPGFPGGIGAGWSVAAAAAGARPDQTVGLAALVVEEVGVDRGGEARIIELEPEIGAALVRLFGPGCADFGAADENPVRGRAFARRIVVGDDTNPFGLNAERHDVADEFAGGGLLESADGSHVDFLSIPETMPFMASMAWGMTGTAAAAAEGPQAKLEDGRTALFCFARNGGALGVPMGSPMGWGTVRGKKCGPAVAAPSGRGKAGFGQQAISKRP